MYRFLVPGKAFLERANCLIFGHDIFDSLRLSYIWCVKCGRRWPRPPRDMPLVGEFYD